jgi:putative endonuclease
MSNRRLLGHSGEQAAAEWYVAHGYCVLARNWRCAAGEIDLLCTRPNPGGSMTLVVCEVKTRTTHSHGHPLEAVTLTKQRRLRRVAAEYLRRQDTSYEHIRFDVVALTRHAMQIVESAF